MTAAANAGAVELADGKLSINGFGQWAYSQTGNANGYAGFDAGSDFSGGSVALALHAQLLERGHVGLQVRFDRDHNATTLDWGFGEWRFSDQLRLQIGLIQHPFGISGDVRDVGTVRPFYLLPSSIYGSADLTGEAIDGVAIRGSTFSGSGWSLRYDAYFGALALPSSSTFDKLAAGFSPGGTIRTTTDETTFVAGGRLTIAAPLEGLSFRLSGYSTLRDTEDVVIGPSIQYAANGFDLRAEYFFHYQGSAPKARTHAAYVEAAYMLTARLQAGVRGDVYSGQLLGYNGSRALLDHREVAATLNYWFDPGLVVKVSAHFIDGNRFALAPALDDAVLAGTLQRTTFAVIAGTQFSF